MPVSRLACPWAEARTARATTVGASSPTEGAGAVGLGGDGAAQAGQERAPGVAGLGGGGRPVLDADGAARDEGGGEEGAGVGQVGLDRHLSAAGAARVHPPGASAVTGLGGGRVDGDAPLAQAGDGHVDMRQGGNRARRRDGEATGQ